MSQAAAQHEVAEAELVARAQQGDPAAFGGLVARYQDRVYNTCLRMCHNHADALDLTQTTFLKALEALTRFDGRAKFYTWLYRIAVNVTLTEGRKRARRSTVSLDGDADGAGIGPTLASDSEAPSAAAERAELRGEVGAALAKVDPEFRIAVVLKDVEDLDYAAIAEILEIPVGTVKSRIYRGRMALRALLQTERTSGAQA